ncbi:MAG: pyruvate ferredoxin oxidoreductase [Candidatus Micrarchaeia archaeon]
MEKITAMVGNHAVAYAVKQAKPEVLAVYPITPQTTMLEKLADYAEKGEMNADLIKVESEHSAMAAIFGAALSGSRVFTATSSQGLLYMTEVIYWAGGQRVPIVAGIATRAVGAPWSIWDDHQDFVSKRDSIWVQMIAENVQDAYDMTLQAFKISEDKRVSMPVMMGFDGFVLTHTMERLSLVPDNDVDSFIPKRDFNLIDFENPIGIGPIVTQDNYIKYRHNAMLAMERSKQVIEEISNQYSQLTDREQHGLVEFYKCEDAEYAIVAMGAWAGDARLAVELLRKQGIKVGLAKIRVLRPFPKERLEEGLKAMKGIIVFDREYSYGSGGILATEIKASLYQLNIPVYSAIGGIGGKEVGSKEMIDIVSNVMQGKADKEVWLL